jgi:hypothetical protein
MRKSKIFIAAVVVTLILNACSNNKASDKPTSQPTTETKSTGADVQRPATTEKELKHKVYQFDSKVASVSSTLRDLKNNMEKGAKITPTITDNITGMITDAKKLREPLLTMSDQLAAEEFRVFNRDKGWIDELETEFESLRQTK